MYWYNNYIIRIVRLCWSRFNQKSRPISEIEIETETAREVLRKSLRERLRFQGIGLPHCEKWPSSPKTRGHETRKGSSPAGSNSTDMGQSYLPQIEFIWLGNSWL